jgi:hypothetical protein
MTPRIYLYKITFEEIPDWYWGVHKERKYNDGYIGSPVTHKWKWEFYTPHLEIVQLFEYSDKGWAESKELEKRVILHDLNNPLCLNENVGGTPSVESLRRGGRNGGRIAGKVGDKEGKRQAGYKTLLLGIGVHTLENRRKGAYAQSKEDKRKGGQTAGSLPWWVNPEGTTKRSHAKPEGKWMRGRKWVEDPQGKSH